MGLGASASGDSPGADGLGVEEDRVRRLHRILSWPLRWLVVLPLVAIACTAMVACYLWAAHDEEEPDWTGL